MVFTSRWAKTAGSVLASAALAATLVPAGAIAAYADDASAEQNASSATDITGEPTADTAGDAASTDTTGDAATGTDTADGSTTDGVGTDITAGGNTGDSSQTVDPEPAATYSVTYSDGAKGKVFTSQVISGITAGTATPAFNGTPKRSGYTFMGWSPKVAKKVTADATYVATWQKNVASADKVVPYLTVKAKYKGGSLTTVGKSVKPGKKVSTSNDASGKYLVSLSFKVDTGSQILDPSFKKKYKLGIKYRVYVNGAWSAWKADGTATGGAKRIEAFQVKLTGTAAKYYTAYTCAQLRYSGWMDWSNGSKACGTSGYGFRDVTGLKIVLKKKTDKAPGDTTLSYFTSKTTTMSYCLKTASGKSYGTKLGATAGSTGSSAWKGITMSISHKGVSGDVSYSVYQGSWSKFVTKGFAGSSAKGKTMRAMKVKLTGNLKKYYDVYYRVRVKGYGKWLGWAKNGAAAGTTSYNIPVIAYQVKLVLKSASAPGSTANSLCNSGSALSELSYKQTLDNKAKNMSSATSYLLMVDTNTCRVGIYKGYKGHWKRIKYWLAGVGAYGKDTQTKKGTFTVIGHEYVFGSDKGYNCWYATQFYGNYLFHSEVYDIGHKDAAHMQSSGLGTHVSHGCVRLKLKNAKWIYDNIPMGSKVKVY